MSERYRLIQGDCLGVLPTLPDASVDLILTDPPYFRVKNEPWDRQWDSADGFLSWLSAILAEYRRVLKPNGSLYLFASPQMAARVEVAVGSVFNVLNHIVWRKTNKNGADAGWHRQTSKEELRTYFPATERIIFAEQYGDQYGEMERALHKQVFAPIGRYIQTERERAGFSRNDVEVGLGYVSSSDPSRGTALCCRWEEGSSLPTPEAYERLRVLLNGNGGDYLAKPHEYLQKEYSYLRREYEDLRKEYEDLRKEYEELRRPFFATPDAPYTDIWDFPTVEAYGGKHPCEKPQALLRHVIAVSTKEGATVLDTFAGSGSAGVAAVSLGRSFIGCELSAHWAERARYAVSEAAKAGVTVRTTRAFVPTCQEKLPLFGD